MGRAVSRTNRFPRSFAFRLEEPVADRLCEVAAAHGYRPAEWARKIVSEVIAVDFVRRAVRLRVLHADLLRTYLVEITRQGNNLNQVARSLNDDRRAERKTDLDPLRRDLEEIRRQNQRLLLAVLDALGAGNDP